MDTADDRRTTSPDPRPARQRPNPRPDPSLELGTELATDGARPTRRCRAAELPKARSVQPTAGTVGRCGEPIAVAPKSRRPWLRSEVARLIVAVVAAAVLVTVGYILVGRALIAGGHLTIEAVTGPSGASALLLRYWIIYCLAYTITTLRTWPGGRRGAGAVVPGEPGGPAASAAVRTADARQRAGRLGQPLRRGPGGGDRLRDQRGPARQPVADLPHLPRRRLLVDADPDQLRRPLRPGEQQRGRARLPGEERDGPPVFSDYVYLAAQVATTFSTSDVTVERRSMRRTVTVHSIATFAYNTVVIALIVSMFLNAPTA